MKTNPKKLWQFFLKRWIILLVIFVITALVGTRIYYEFITTTRAYEDNIRFKGTVSYLESLSKTVMSEPYDDALFDNRIKDILCSSSNNRIYSQWGVENALVLIDKNGEIKYTSEEQAFVSHYDNEKGISTIYICANDSMLELTNKYYQDAGLIPVDIDDKHYQEADLLLVDIEDVYVKDNKFLPGRISVLKLAGEWCSDDTEIIDLTPADTEGYTHITDGLNCDIYGTSPESSLYKELIEAVSPQNIENFDMHTAYLPNGIIRYASAATVDINGSVYTLYELRTHDFYSVYGKNFFIIYVILFVLSIGIALLTAAFSYSKYRTKYNNEKYRRTMTDTMAHDLKSPLTAISGYAENLMENLNTDKREHYALAILGNVQYMNDIITNVLELSRLENKTSPMTREELDLPALAAELFKKYELRAEEKNISIKISGSCIISADKQMMIKALDNLLSNAVKYTRPDGNIIVTANSKSFTITNDSAENISVSPEQLTEPFVKGDISRSSKQGSGLGLSIVKIILDMHGYSMGISTDYESFSVRVTF